MENDIKMEIDGICFAKQPFLAGSSIDQIDSLPSSPKSVPQVTNDSSSPDYDMTGTKLMFIFNHTSFKESIHYPTPDKPREGTECDVASLRRTFGKPGRFEVDEPYNDFTHSEIIEKMSKISKMDHRSTSCIAIVILTNGGENGLLKAADKPYPVNDVINIILDAPGLAGKPKLFFILACRDGIYEPGLFSIPTHSDCLIMLSSFEDQVSFRRNEGSWMIQSLCDVIDTHYHDCHFLDMMTQVNSAVKRKICLCNVDPRYQNKKQVPEIRFALTKFLRF